MDLDMAVHVLGFDGHQQRAEPFERAKVSADPEEIDLSKTRLLLRVIHPVPDALQNRSERSNANAGTDQNGNLVLEDVFRCTAEGPIDVDSRENLSNGRIDACAGRSVIDTHNCRALGSFLLSIALEIAA